jgi:pyruvate-ferredoxin/flavodoxin oxidoreductase
VVRRNFAAIERALEALHAVDVPARVTATAERPPRIPPEAPDFVQRVTGVILDGKGDALPVSAFPPDGTWPTGTARWEKRSIAREIPQWDPGVCIQCNKCAMVCPHAAVRVKAYPEDTLQGAPAAFRRTPYRDKHRPAHAYSVQVAPDDCTGCTLCVEVCPARDKSNPRHKALDMVPIAPELERERESFDFFLKLPDPPRPSVSLTVKDAQLFLPLFEFSGACSGCGETPYVKLLTQLFGDRTVIANATGCSSIYGGNLPTTPYTTDASGRGPAWSNSLFEDNAEFGLGIRLAIDHQRIQARMLLDGLRGPLGATCVDAILGGDGPGEAEIAAQRERIEELLKRLAPMDTPAARRLVGLSEFLTRRDVWIVGGDGWAYDIGYGGLDHVLASGKDVNVLVLDTEVYSNTGGQQSKATPLGASAKFAVNGKTQAKKDLGLLAMAYGNVYVAQVALGARDRQVLEAFVEAESYPGPSLIIAYSHCIAHGYDLSQGLSQQKLAVQTGYWPLYRFDPRRTEHGDNPLVMDCQAPSKPLREFRNNETRFNVLDRIDPDRSRELSKMAQEHVDERFAHYVRLASGSGSES